jgi:hypothetical protein
MSYALHGDQLAEYRDQGYLVLRGLFQPEEVGELEAEADRLLRRTELIDPNNLRVRWQPHVVTGEQLFEVFDPVIDIAPVCARLAGDARLRGALTSVYGEEPCLFKDKLIYKPPGARGYGLHQDYIGWPGFPKSFMTVVVAIDPFDDSSGGTEVFPGYHKQGYLGREDGRYHPITEDQVPSARAVPLELAPGDVAIFGCFLPHRSAPNTTDRCRRGLFLSYNACSDGGDQRESHYRQFHDYMRSKAPDCCRGGAAMYFR